MSKHDQGSAAYALLLAAAVIFGVIAATCAIDAVPEQETIRAE